MKKYITTPIYYVNDVPHLGHAYTTVAGDVLARYYRLKGEEVKFLTGTDEHGQKNAESAEKAGLTPQAYVDQRSAEFKQTFEELGVQFDADTIFMRTTNPEHKEAVDVFMKKLDAAGALYEGRYEGLYCKGCEEFKTEKDLVDGLCPIHKTKPELIQEKNWFFKLSDYKDKVRSLIESGELAVEPEARRNEVLGLINDSPDFSVTRERVKWGIPFFKDSSQIIYVWVEALQNYISALGYPDGDDFKKFWPADVHLMAKDIVKFHAIYWPAMVLAAGEKLPKKIFAHGFFTLNGQKMSKSLGNVIHPHELVEQFGVEATRYLLLTQFPFGNDGDMSIERFRTLYTAELVNGLGNLVSRVTTLVATKIDGKCHKGSSLGDTWMKQYPDQIELLDLYGAATSILEVVQDSNNYLDQEKPWSESDSNKLKLVLGRLLATLEEIANMVEPFMPETAMKMRASINADKIQKIEPLFPRIGIKL